jgi:hypothetical protein
MTLINENFMTEYKKFFEENKEKYKDYYNYIID